MSIPLAAAQSAGSFFRKKKLQLVPHEKGLRGMPTKKEGSLSG
jgi:hypothetical protein